MLFKNNTVPRFVGTVRFNIYSCDEKEVICISIKIAKIIQHKY